MTRPWPDRVIDPHIHQWDPFTTPRIVSDLARQLRFVPRVPKALGRLAPLSQREFAANPHHAVKPYLPQHYRGDAGEVPVDAVVHIEASWQSPTPLGSVEETRWVEALPFGRDGAAELGAVVVHADPAEPEVGEVLDAHLEASPRVRGVRRSVAHHPDPDVLDFHDRPDALADPAFVDGFAAIAERGLSFELWMYAHQLPDAERLVREYPETTFVLDHYATPVGLFGPRGAHTGRSETERGSLLDRWHDDLAALAAHPNVVAKHSGLGMAVLGGDPARPYDVGEHLAYVDRVAPLVRHLHECFGPDRTMWASNYPMDKAVHTLPASLALVLDVLGSDADPQRLLHDVAARTYRLD